MPRMLLEACRKLGGCETGEAKITPGYNLYAKWVIHTVGPIWRGGQHSEDELLAKCYRNSLALAALHGIESLAFPAISTGAYGFPKERAARIAVREVVDFMGNNAIPPKVCFVCFGKRIYDMYINALKAICEG